MEAGSRETYLHNLGQVERVLGWMAGSMDLVLAGGEPTLLEEPRNGGTAPDDEQGSTADQVVQMIIEVLGTELSDTNKLRLIRKLIEDEYRPSGVQRVTERLRDNSG